MYQPIQITHTIPAVRSSVSPATAGRRVLFVALAWLVLSPTVRAVNPPPDGGYANQNTAEGTQALFSLTTGGNNTAIGFNALFSNTTGGNNTATGFEALYHNIAGVFGIPGDNTANGYQSLYRNTTGILNTAMGDQALFNNTTGIDNTAIGFQALFSMTTGFGGNTATGVQALFSNTTGAVNTATGVQALFSMTTGFGNTATGDSALFFNSTGSNNTATGESALFGCSGGEDCLSGNFSSTGDNNTATGADTLFSNTGNGNTATGVGALGSNTTGNNNTADGFGALANSFTGSNNIALGANAGSNLSEGSNNIYIGVPGVAVESNTIRIGTVGVHKSAYVRGISGATVAGGVGVIVDTKGHLGTVSSSARFKDEIKPMDKASEAILALKPVTFRYKKQLDPDGIPQFGLVAEDVEKVNPDLVARDADGKVYTVRYEAVNAMLLNEFLKAHRQVEEQSRKIQEQAATITKLEKGMETIVAHLKEQDSKIEKVSAQLALDKPEPKVVLSNQ